MQTQKIAIVSSYREACGPAAHTIYLEKAFKSLGYEVDVIKLDVSLMRATSSVVRKHLKREMAEIVRRANQADGVIFQIEPGLYGPAPWISYSRINKLMDKVKVRSLVVLHGFDRPSLVYQSMFGMIKEIISPFSLRAKRYIFSKLALRWNLAYLGFFRRLRDRKVVCFSRGDTNELAYFKGIKSTYVPISYLLREEINHFKEIALQTRKDICERIGVDEDHKLIIAPGFVNGYKNTIVTVDSLQFLPSNFHLIIAGGVHPHSSQLNPSLIELTDAKSPGTIPKPSFANPIRLSGAAYKGTNSAVSVIEYPKEVRDRVHFVGSLDDDSLNAWIAASDFVVLPYLNTETGQSGSGPFTLAIEIGKQSFFGSAAVFRAQDFVKSTSPFMFDSANSAELAYCLKNAERDKVAYDKFVTEFRDNYTAESQAEIYVKLLEK